MDTLLVALTLIAATGAGLVAGVFFAFSVFVMRALARLPAAQGIAAMQSINVTVITPPFLLALFGTAVLGLALAVVGAMSWDGPSAPWRVAGGLAYAVGTVGTTMAANVPMNEKLARLEPAAGDAAGYWSHYVARWTAWNHVRTAAALVAAVCLMLAS